MGKHQAQDPLTSRCQRPRNAAHAWAQRGALSTPNLGTAKPQWGALHLPCHPVPRHPPHAPRSPLNSLALANVSRAGAERQMRLGLRLARSFLPCGLPAAPFIALAAGGIETIRAYLGLPPSCASPD